MSRFEAPVSVAATAAASVAALTAFAAILVLVNSGATAGLDRGILFGLHSALRATGAYQSLTSFFGVVAALSDTVGVALLAIAATLLCVLRKAPRRAVLVALSAAGGSGLSQSVKHAVGRQRPHLFHDLPSVSGFAFPSGDAVSVVTGIALSIIVLASLVPQRGWRVALWSASLASILLVDGSRLVLGVHWPTDVVAGNLLGLAWIAALLSAGLALKRFARGRAPTASAPDGA